MSMMAVYKDDFFIKSNEPLDSIYKIVLYAVAAKHKELSETYKFFGSVYMWPKVTETDKKDIYKCEIIIKVPLRIITSKFDGVADFVSDWMGETPINPVIIDACIKDNLAADIIDYIVDRLKADNIMVMR